MKFLLIVLAALFPIVAHSIGAASDTDWPKGAIVEVQLKLSAVTDTNGHLKVSGDLMIKNPGDTALTIQSPHNRLEAVRKVSLGMGVACRWDVYK